MSKEKLGHWNLVIYVFFLRTFTMEKIYYFLFNNTGITGHTGNKGSERMERSNAYRSGFLPYALAAFLIGIVGGFSTVLGPAFVQDLGIAYNNTTWTALAQAMSTAACAPILGKAGDVIGRRTTLLSGIAAFTLGNILSALADSLIFMMIARFIVGIGIAAMYPVIMAYIVTEFPEKKIAQALNAAGYPVKCVFHDATKPDTFASMMEELITDAGQLDVLVNNFGTSNPGKDLDFANTDPQVFLDTVNLNLRSVFMACQTAAKHMTAHGGGSIINISSVGGIVPDISQVAYGTSKAAINYLTKLIAVHEAKNKIRCNAVLPGMTATEAVVTNLSEDFRSLFFRHIPFGRMGLPEEIAAAVVYLASSEAAYTTGQILTGSGGFGLATPLFGDLANKTVRR